MPQTNTDMFHPGAKRPISGKLKNAGGSVFILFLINENGRMQFIARTLRSNERGNTPLDKGFSNECRKTKTRVN